MVPKPSRPYVSRLPSKSTTLTHTHPYISDTIIHAIKTIIKSVQMQAQSFVNGGRCSEQGCDNASVSPAGEAKQLCIKHKVLLLFKNRIGMLLIFNVLLFVLE